MGVRDLDVTVGEYRLRVCLIGNAHPAELPLLVFLHEGLGSITQWKDFPQRLAERLGTAALVYDRHGYGRSSRLTAPRHPGYLHHEAWTVLPQLLSSLALRHRLVLIGHSDGGSIALLHASLFPDRVAAVLTEAAHVFVEDVTLQGIRTALADFAAGRLRPLLERHHGENVDTMFHSWADAWLSAEFRSWNIEEHLPRIHAPLLVAQGEQDQYGTLAQVETIAAKVSGPAEKLVLPDCGHIPHHEATERVLDEMASFIRRWT